MYSVVLDQPIKRLIYVFVPHWIDIVLRICLCQDQRMTNLTFWGQVHMISNVM